MFERSRYRGEPAAANLESKGRAAMAIFHFVVQTIHRIILQIDYPTGENKTET
jgi:hypothetical protein